MSKENLRKHTSIKNHLPELQKRQSHDFKQLTSDQKVVTSTSQQTEVMKKIQNKLRMRKRSTNLNQNDRTITPPQVSSNDNLSNQNIGEDNYSRRLQGYDLTLNIPETVQQVLQTDQKIHEKISLTHSNKSIIKQQLIKDSTFILCQLNKGRRIQEILLQRVTTIIQSNKLRQRIQQKQKSIMAMMDQRIRKLMLLQKPLVH